MFLLSLYTLNNKRSEDDKPSGIIEVDSEQILLLSLLSGWASFPYPASEKDINIFMDLLRMELVEISFIHTSIGVRFKVTPKGRKALAQNQLLLKSALERLEKENGEQESEKTQE